MSFLGLDGGAAVLAPLVSLTGRVESAAMSGSSTRWRPGAALWGTARSLNEWHNRHGFCGICGGETGIFRGGWGRRCGQCEAEHFPRVDPVVIMLAEHEGRVLLGRQPQYPPGCYSALAGFVEPGESIEEAVARELMEEAGVTVGAVRYVASQPWPFPGSLMIACIADADERALTLDAERARGRVWAGARASPPPSPARRMRRSPLRRISRSPAPCSSAGSPARDRLAPSRPAA